MALAASDFWTLHCREGKESDDTIRFPTAVYAGLSGSFWEMALWQRVDVGV